MIAISLAALFGPLTANALASDWAGSDPSSNFTIGALPPACDTDPTGADCTTASVDYLNQARASLGQPPYSLPADFASLTPAQQALVLVDSDRTLYNLPPITGLTDELDQDAAAGALSDSDPEPSTSDWYGYTSNAAWGNVNMVLAYGGWMYDDGPGSNNVDCTSANQGGCWGHRHDILWQFGPGALAMGAAAGTDSSGSPSFTMLLMQGSPSYEPAYVYTWAPAQVGGSASTPPPPPAAAPAPAGDDPAAVAAGATMTIESLRVHAHRLTVGFGGSDTARALCSLTRVHGRVHRAKACGTRVTFGHLRAGRYRLRVTSSAGVLTRHVLVS
jgi:hypothetical protein